MVPTWGTFSNNKRKALHFLVPQKRIGYTIPNLLSFLLTLNVHPFTAACQFAPKDTILSVLPYGSGNVHDTFRVTVGRVEENQFLLQRLKAGIFQNLEEVMHNIRIFSEHARNRLENSPLELGRRWEIPRILMTAEGSDLWKDGDGFRWRAFSWIDQARSFDAVQDLNQAGEIGWALGIFHNLIHDLPLETLFDTLEGFHVTPHYLRCYDRVLSQKPPGKSPELDFALLFVKDRRRIVAVLEEARNQGYLNLRPIHGDPKVNNVMIDTVSGQAVGLVDLDTVKPGLIHYDLGDCLRSSSNPLGEESEKWEAVCFKTELCRAVWEGYLDRAGEFLTDYDYAFMFEAVRLIAFELGLRFLTDFLEGNVYFKTGHPRQNLIRALVQFKLTQSIEEQEKEIRAIFRKPG
ncbi:MAG: aminoglycoside phosphotransferase family protein [Thermodesulfobacteriota bacterium]